MSGPYRLAIDLGTCNTVAVVDRGTGQPRALIFDGSPMLPSAVFVDRSGATLVGRDAERLMATDPARFEPHPKRRVDEGHLLLGDREVAVAELLAAVLRRVVVEASHAGVPAAGATVLTCPADWGPQRRAVLAQAARIAGLGEVVLLDEPVAAGHYCLSVLGQQVAADRCVAVFDFGGGTLDVTVAGRSPDGLRVLATGGLDDLGGTDIDAALAGHLGQMLSVTAGPAWHRLDHPRTATDLRDRQMFWSEVRAAKEMLSRASSAPVQVPGTEHGLHLTRVELDRVAGPLVDRAVDETRRVLDRSRVEPGQLEAILLVGGGSRLPLVASRLHARFGRAPLVPEQPELPVAYGALLLANASSVSGQLPVANPGRFGSPSGQFPQSGQFGSPSGQSPPAGQFPQSGQFPPTNTGQFGPAAGPGAPIQPTQYGQPGQPTQPAQPARPARPSVIIGPGVTIQGSVGIYGSSDQLPPDDEPDDVDEHPPVPTDRRSRRSAAESRTARDEPRSRRPARRLALGTRLRVLVSMLLPVGLILALTPSGRDFANRVTARIVGSAASAEPSPQGSQSPQPRGATASPVPALILSRASGSPGIALAIRGQGFAEAEQVDLATTGQQQLGTVTAAGPNGTFLHTFVPRQKGLSKPGRFVIVATGRDSGRTVEASYEVTG